MTPTRPPPSSPESVGTKLIGTAFSDYFTDSAKAEQIYQLVFSEGMAVD